MVAHPLNKKLRQCQNCGHITEARYASHKIYQPALRRMVYCGYMRVVRDE